MTAIAVLVGLAAMHGISATAAAAAPCGASVAHVHADVLAVPRTPPTDQAPRMVAPAVDPDGHAGMLCLVVLLAGIALSVTVWSRRSTSTPQRFGHATTLRPTHGRGPPPLLLACVSRT